MRHPQGERPLPCALAKEGKGGREKRFPDSPLDKGCVSLEMEYQGSAGGIQSVLQS